MENILVNIYLRILKLHENNTNMLISYLITCSTETDTLRNLLNCVKGFKDEEDEIIILVDSGNLNLDTQQVISEFLSKHASPTIFYYEHNLNKNYSEHKNYGMSKCSGEYIFQIDGDEIPTEELVTNVKTIIESNPNVEAFWIPRVNLFKGVEEVHAKQWGWRLSMSKRFNVPIVNAYDPQCRLFLNELDRIKWEGRLHERIVGNKNYVFIPDENETLALLHIKTIEKQLETNRRYNEIFTEKENKGFTVPQH